MGESKKHNIGYDQELKILRANQINRYLFLSNDKIFK